MRFFDCEKVASEANMPPDKLDKLRQLIRQEFPHDEMMFELHLLRACMAIRNGILTVDQALRSEQASPV
ncbi:MAG: hypothetical protein LAO07_02680 [Acidobacteriia bacterium]|nr:hypothetical protein [Terriglobia bacterium]